MLAKKAHLQKAPDSSRAQILESLKKVSLLSEIHNNDLALEAFSKLVTLVHFSSGHDIIREGSEGGELFILVKGNAAVYKATPGGEPYKVAILSGEKHVAFGEGGLIGSDQRGASIRTEDACDCLVINRPDFENFALEFPAWALPIYRRVAQSVMIRLRKSNDDMLLLYNALVAEIRGS